VLLKEGGSLKLVLFMQVLASVLRFNHGAGAACHGISVIPHHNSHLPCLQRTGNYHKRQLLHRLAAAII